MKKIIEEMQDFIYGHPEASDATIWDELAYRIARLIDKIPKETE